MCIPLFYFFFLKKEYFSTNDNVALWNFRFCDRVGDISNIALTKRNFCFYLKDYFITIHNQTTYYYYCLYCYICIPQKIEQYAEWVIYFVMFLDNIIYKSKVYIFLQNS